MKHFFTLQLDKFLTLNDVYATKRVSESIMFTYFRALDKSQSRLLYNILSEIKECGFLEILLANGFHSVFNKHLRN